MGMKNFQAGAQGGHNFHLVAPGCSKILGHEETLGDSISVIFRDHQ